MNTWDLVKWAYQLPLTGRKNSVAARRLVLLYIATKGYLQGNSLRVRILGPAPRKQLATATGLGERRLQRAIQALEDGRILVPLRWTKRSLWVENELIRDLRKSISEQ